MTRAEKKQRAMERAFASMQQASELRYGALTAARAAKEREAANRAAAEQAAPKRTAAERAVAEKAAAEQAAMETAAAMEAEALRQEAAPQWRKAATHLLTEAAQSHSLEVLEECIARHGTAASAEALLSASSARDRLRRESTDRAEVALAKAHVSASAQLERPKPLNEAERVEMEASLVALRRAIAELATQPEATGTDARRIYGVVRLREARALWDELADEVSKGTKLTKLEQKREQKERAEARARQQKREEEEAAAKVAEEAAIATAMATAPQQKVRAKAIAAAEAAAEAEVDGGDGGGGGGGGDVGGGEGSAGGGAAGGADGGGGGGGTAPSDAAVAHFSSQVTQLLSQRTHYYDAGLKGSTALIYFDMQRTCFVLQNNEGQLPLDEPRLLAFLADDLRKNVSPADGEHGQIPNPSPSPDPNPNLNPDPNPNPKQATTGRCSCSSCGSSPSARPSSSRRPRSNSSTHLHCLPAPWSVPLLRCYSWRPAGRCFSPACGRGPWIRSVRTAAQRPSRLLAASPSASSCIRQCSACESS